MKIILTFAVMMLCSCAHTRYYAPVLMQKTSADQPIYSALFATGVVVPKSTDNARKYAEISIPAIRPGFLHRGGVQDHWSKRDKANAWKDKDLWVLIQVEGLEGNDLFESKVDRKAVFSHVVMNAPSYDSVTVDIQPIPIELNKVHRIKAKVYSIDKFLLRKAIFESKDKSLGKWALDTVQDLGKAVSNVFLKEAFDYYKTISDQNFTLEQFLITAGSNLEFSGSFDIVPSGSGELPITNLALYDFIKSENDPEWKQAVLPGFTYTPTGVAEYSPVYKAVKASNVILSDEVRPNSSQQELQKSFVKFTITPKAADELKRF
jgi:hypothetical protein